VQGSPSLVAPLLTGPVCLLSWFEEPVRPPPLLNTNSSFLYHIKSLAIFNLSDVYALPHRQHSENLSTRPGKARRVAADRLTPTGCCEWPAWCLRLYWFSRRRSSISTNKHSPFKSISRSHEVRSHIDVRTLDTAGGGDLSRSPATCGKYIVRQGGPKRQHGRTSRKRTTKAIRQGGRKMYAKNVFKRLWIVYAIWRVATFRDNLFNQRTQPWMSHSRTIETGQAPNRVRDIIVMVSFTLTQSHSTCMSTLYGIAPGS